MLLLHHCANRDQTCCYFTTVQTEIRHAVTSPLCKQRTYMLLLHHCANREPTCCYFTTVQTEIRHAATSPLCKQRTYMLLLHHCANRDQTCCYFTTVQTETRHAATSPLCKQRSDMLLLHHCVNRDRTCCYFKRKFIHFSLPLRKTKPFSYASISLCVDIKNVVRFLKEASGILCPWKYPKTTKIYPKYASVENVIQFPLHYIDKLTFIFHGIFPQ